MEEGPVTRLLQDYAAGDKGALDRLVPFVYDELKRLARGFLRGERPGHTLQPTALVHEAYAKLLHQNCHTYHNRVHFISVAARVMRQVLVDHARIHRAARRDQGRPKLSLEEARTTAAEQPAVMIALADALDALEDTDAVKAHLIEMRYFGGLTLEESAEAAGLTVESVRYQLRLAQAFLQRELSRDQTETPVK
ncbi:MAG: ECF-type sigma factor [Bryobacteraceae bacterium]